MEARLGCRHKIKKSFLQVLTGLNITSNLCHHFRFVILKLRTPPQPSDVCQNKNPSVSMKVLLQVLILEGYQNQGEKKHSSSSFGDFPSHVCHWLGVTNVCVGLHKNCHGIRGDLCFEYCSAFLGANFKAIVCPFKRPSEGGPKTNETCYFWRQGFGRKIPTLHFLARGEGGKGQPIHTILNDPLQGREDWEFKGLTKQ